MNGIPDVNRLYSETLENRIIEGVREAQREEFLTREIQASPSLPARDNEFLFFIKPEITAPSDTIQLSKVLRLILDKIETFGLRIGWVKILSSGYLEKFSIIAEHYGVINQMATNPVYHISDTARRSFETIYGISIEEVNLVGAIELLKGEPELDPYSIDSLWRKSPAHKLAGGVYCARMEWKGKQIFVVNGFHPRQLNHFTEKGRSIVVLSLSGTLSWKQARSSFVGATDPVNAEFGSIRRELLEQKSELGLPEISQSYNGVHLSAGPVESLCEHKRFISDFSDTARIKDYTSFSFGSRLSNVFNESDFQRIVANENVLVNGKSISIFDLTENCDSTQAISLLREVMPKY